MSLIGLGRLLFRYRGVVPSIVLVVVLLVCTPLHLQGDPEQDSWMDLAGALVVVLGLSVRAVTIGYQYIVRGGRNRQVHADTLVQTGVYAHTRNQIGRAHV